MTRSRDGGSHWQLIESIGVNTEQATQWVSRGREMLYRLPATLNKLRSLGVTLLQVRQSRTITVGYVSIQEVRAVIGGLFDRSFTGGLFIPAFHAANSPTGPAPNLGGLLPHHLAVLFAGLGSQQHTGYGSHCRSGY